jgi:hypothetical protein
VLADRPGRMEIHLGLALASVGNRHKVAR